MQNYIFELAKRITNLEYASAILNNAAVKLDSTVSGAWTVNEGQSTLADPREKTNIYITKVSETKTTVTFKELFSVDMINAITSGTEITCSFKPDITPDEKVSTTATLPKVTVKITDATAGEVLNKECTGTITETGAVSYKFTTDVALVVGNTITYTL
jgi:hypothetical protein